MRDHHELQHVLVDVGCVHGVRDGELSLVGHIVLGVRKYRCAVRYMQYHIDCMLYLQRWVLFDG